MANATKATPRAKAKQKQKQLNAKQARELGTAYAAAIESGRESYARAGELVDKMVAGGLVGVEFDLGDGRTFKLVDQFAGGKATVFKPTAFSRFKAEVSGGAVSGNNAT